MYEAEKVSLHGAVELQVYVGVRNYVDSLCCYSLIQKSPFLDVADEGGSGTDDEEQHVHTGHKLFSMIGHNFFL